MITMFCYIYILPQITLKIEFADKVDQPNYKSHLSCYQLIIYRTLKKRFKTAYCKQPH